MASSGTWTLARDTSGPLEGLAGKGGWPGDMEWNSGLPGAEPRLWALDWDTAGEPGWRTWAIADELLACPDTAAGIPKLAPKIWPARLKIN